MSSRLLLPVSFLTFCLMQTTPVHAAGFLEAKAYPGGEGTLAMATGDFNGDGHLDLALANSTNSTVGIVLGNSDGSYQVPLEFSGGTAVDYLAVGDFNGDGKLDVVTVNHLTDKIGVLLGNGDGTLQGVVFYSTGSQPRAVTAADLNGDGKVDVVTANLSGTISVLLGRGDASFGPHTEFAVGNAPIRAAVADFNRDNKADILVSTTNHSTTSLLLGNGDGTFQTHQTITQFYGTAGVAIADFNGDGNLDFAASGANLAVFLGKGNGTFQPETDYQVAYSAGLAVGDLNGDGKLDLVSGGTGGSVLLGNGDGTFGPTTYFSSVWGNAYVAVADLNGDGKADIVGTQDFYSLGYVNVLLGLGDGTFLSHRDFYAGSSAGHSVAADFNGDGKLDVALVTDPNGDKVAVLLGNGDGTLTNEPVQFTTGHIPEAVATGDMNGDGKFDLVVAISSGVNILLGNGDATFQNHLDFGVADGGFNLVLGDFNNDEKLDAAVADYQGMTVGVFRGYGDGTLGTQVDYPVGQYDYQVATGDFNSDGKLDLIVTNGGSDSLSMLLGNGDGTFQPEVRIATGSKSGPRVIAVADLNHDGKLDLAFTTFCPDFNVCFFQASVRLGHGDGKFSSQVNYGLPFGFAPEAIAVGDVNGDGKPDLVTAVATDGNPTSVLPGNGDGTFQPRLDYAGGGYSLTLADFNRDGALDVASGGGLLSMLLNTAGTVFKTTASPNPVKQGQPVTFNVSLRATVVGQPVVTGTVTLRDGSTTLKVLTLREGRARFVTSILSVGTHTITAKYSGDSNFISKTSKPITLKVNP